MIYKMGISKGIDISLCVIAVLMLQILIKRPPLASHHLALILNSPITDSDASHIHCTLNCICKKDHDILYHGTMYHTPLNNTWFSIDAYNALIASIYLHQCFYILKILAHSVDFNELYRHVTIHCPSFSLVI